MSPRRPSAPDPDELARLRRLLAEGAAPSPPKRQRRQGRGAATSPADDPGSWSPGEEWEGDAGVGDAGVGGDDEAAPAGGRGGRWWEQESPARPIRVEGGLVARTRRGAIGGTWWSRRFLAAVEAAMEGGRPGRGRAYARAGQVLGLEVLAGVVEAAVQGSRPHPYRVRLRMPMVEGPDWDRIMGDLAARAGYAARMLAGELPHQLEEVFEAQGSALFPGPGARLTTECSCPDWANPCKHVAAVCYLVAEMFDEDPFALLAWRGHPRDEVLAELRRRRAGAADTDGGPQAGTVPGAAARRGRRPTAPTDPLDSRIGDWWQAGGMLADIRVRPAPAEDPAAILDRVAPGTVQLAGREVAEVLAPVYALLASAALRRALGEG